MNQQEDSILQRELGFARWIFGSVCAGVDIYTTIKGSELLLADNATDEAKASAGVVTLALVLLVNIVLLHAYPLAEEVRRLKDDSDGNLRTIGFSVVWLVCLGWDMFTSFQTIDHLYNSSIFAMLGTGMLAYGTVSFSKPLYAIRRWMGEQVGGSHQK